MKKALLVIDLQNDYFPGGKFPLWNTYAILQNIERAIAKANAQGIPVIHIQHVAKQGMAPFFNEGTPGQTSIPASSPPPRTPLWWSRSLQTASRRRTLKKR